MLLHLVADLFIQHSNATEMFHCMAQLTKRYKTLQPLGSIDVIEFPDFMAIQLSLCFALADSASVFLRLILLLSYLVPHTSGKLMSHVFVRTRFGNKFRCKF